MAFQLPMGNPHCAAKHTTWDSALRILEFCLEIQVWFFYKDWCPNTGTVIRERQVLRAITHIEEEIGIVPLPGLMQFRIWFAEVPMLSVMNTVNVNCALHIWNTLWCQMLEDQGPGTSGRCSKFSRYSLPGLRAWAYQLENGTIPHQKIILFNPSKASCACLLFSFKWGSVDKCSASSSCLTGKRK